MYEIEIKSSKDPGHHECTASREGDWDVYRCPICKDYERRINRLTGEMKVSNPNAHFRHSGFNLTNPHLEKWNSIGTISGSAIWDLN